MVRAMLRCEWLGRLVLAVWLAGSVAVTAQGIGFADVTAAAGIAYPLPMPIPDLGDDSVSQTGGAAAGDFDNDGWPDLFVTRYWDSPFLYRNNHDGTFTDVTSSAFSAGVPGPSSGGASWGDVDNDSDLDLYVTSVFQWIGKPSLSQ